MSIKQDGENAMTVDDIVAEFAKTKKARATRVSVQDFLSQRKLLTPTLRWNGWTTPKDPCSFITALVE
jgi:hypothetical protein